MDPLPDRDALLAQLRSRGRGSSVRSRALWILTNTAKSKAQKDALAPVLLDVFDNPRESASLRHDAAYALRTLKSSSHVAVPALLAAFLDLTLVPQVHHAAGWALAALGRLPKVASQVAPALIPILSDKRRDPWLRAMSAQILKASPTTTESVLRLYLRLLQDKAEDDDVRTSVCEAMGRLLKANDDPRITAALLVVAKDSDKKSRLAARARTILSR